MLLNIYLLFLSIFRWKFKMCCQARQFSSVRMEIENKSGGFVEGFS